MNNTVEKIVGDVLREKGFAATADAVAHPIAEAIKAEQNTFVDGIMVYTMDPVADHVMKTDTAAFWVMRNKMTVEEFHDAVYKISEMAIKEYCKRKDEYDKRP